MKRVKNPGEVVCLDARSRVLDGDDDGMLIRACGAYRGANCNPSTFGELDRVAQQVDHDLSDLPLVAHEYTRQRGVLLERELESLLLGQLAEHPMHIVQQRVQRK